MQNEWDQKFRAQAKEHQEQDEKRIKEHTQAMQDLQAEMEEMRKAKDQELKDLANEMEDMRAEM